MNANLRKHSSAFVDDDVLSGELCLVFLDDAKYTMVGDKMEWAPALWIEYEKEKLKKFNKITVINVLGKLIDFDKIIKSHLDNIDVEVYNIPEISWSHFAKEIKNLHKEETIDEKTQTFWTSIGVMRLNRFIFLSHLSKINCLSTALYPSMSREEFDYMCYQISKISKDMYGKVADIPLIGKRIFGDVKPFEFNILARENLKKSMYSLNAIQPCVDYYVQRHDEKYFMCIADETIPIGLNEPNTNTESILNFQPYKLINEKYEGESNAVLRWQGILDTNSELFTNFDLAKETYNKNTSVIKHNKQVLYDSDWDKIVSDSFQKLPGKVCDVLNNTNMKGALKYVF